MEYKTFLGKYRVANDEMALAAPPPGDDALETETPRNLAETPGTAAVYRGQEIDSGRDVAVEVIPAFSLKSSVREQLEAEALAAKKIDHINIPALYDFGVEDDHLIYVTEYFDGTSAEEWVNAHGPMPTGAAFRIALQVVGAMGAASFHKISHHAINPSNVILVPGQTPDGDWPLVKVLHFVGVAPAFSSADPSVALFDRSLHYASPEQLQHGTVDFRSEIYSLGATIWFLLTGAPPLTAPQGPVAVQPATIGPAADKLGGMPKKVKRLLAQMLSVNPEARPQEPLAFYRQIQDCLAQVDRRETMARRFGVPMLSTAPKLPGRRRFPAIALALAALILVLGVVAALTVPAYLRHQRIRQAEEPIGVPIGVTEPVVAAAPVTQPNTTESSQPSAETSVVAANTTTTQQQQPPPPAPATAPDVSSSSQAPAETSVVTANPATTQPQPAPPAPATAPNAAESTQAPTDTALVSVDKKEEQPRPPPPLEEPAPPAPVESAPAVAANEAQPPVTRPPAKTQTEERREVAANEVKKTRDVTAAPRKAETVQPPATEPNSNRDTEIAANIPTARRVSPEVRRAEPAPPEEGPDEEAVTSSEQETQPAAVRPTRSEQRTENSSRRTERTAKTKRPSDKDPERRIRVVDEAQEMEAPMPRQPDGRIRARFIGVTPEGNWMFALPSKKIVILPPPPGG